jgi:hypothetical protein
MNKEAMLAVADVIEWADRFDLSNWAVDVEKAEKWRESLKVGNFAAEDGEVDAATLWESCGTTGCIAGWTNAWADNKDASDTRTAADELGLEYDEMWKLFFPDSEFWIRIAPEYKIKFNGDSVEPTARQAARVLRDLAKGKLKLVDA